MGFHPSIGNPSGSFSWKKDDVDPSQSKGWMVQPTHDDTTERHTNHDTRATKHYVQMGRWNQRPKDDEECNHVEG